MMSISTMLCIYHKNQLVKCQLHWTFQISSVCVLTVQQSHLQLQSSRLSQLAVCVHEEGAGGSAFPESWSYTGSSSHRKTFWISWYRFGTGNVQNTPYLTDVSCIQVIPHFLYISGTAQGTISCTVYCMQDRWYVLHIFSGAVHTWFPAHILNMSCKLYIHTVQLMELIMLVLTNDSFD